MIELTKKLKLNDFSVMTEGEMKLVIGGYDATDTGGTGTGYPGLPGSGTYNDPFQLPDVVVKANKCDSLPSCGADAAHQYCRGKRCGETCYTNLGQMGECGAYSAGYYVCKGCWIG